jgi:hypothetical protein
VVEASPTARYTDALAAGSDSATPPQPARVRPNLPS